MPESPMASVQSDAKLPLSRITVLDLTLARAGPTCVRHLADWGAEIIRIEPPAHTDGLGGSRDGYDFQNLHRNKRAIALDLKTEKGREVFFKLAKDADVIVENMRMQVKYRLRFVQNDKAWKMLGINVDATKQ